MLVEHNLSSFSVPSTPVDLVAVAKEPGELLITWNPPKLPNGNVTHYYVYWQLQEVDEELFDQRDYCINREWAVALYISLQFTIIPKSVFPHVSCYVQIG
jgi:hypothetical protein